MSYSPHHTSRLAVLLATLAATSLAQGTADAFVVKIPGASMTSSVILALSGATGSPGGTVEIPIDLTCKGTAAPAAFQLDLSFDAQKLTFVSAQAGSGLTAANKSISSTVLANGYLRLLTAGLNQSSITDGTVASVSFTLNPAFVTGSTALTAMNCTSSSGSGGSLATGCTSATVNTFGCDINADGAVNVADVQLIINEALGVIPQVHDLNHDGVVNVADVQKAINAALGLGCSY